MKYFVIDKNKKCNFLRSLTLRTEIFHEKSLFCNLFKSKNSPRPNNADFRYFTHKIIIKTCTKFHFVMNLFPDSTHI